MHVRELLEKHDREKEEGRSKKPGEVPQSGSCQSSCMAGDYVYVFTTFYADMFAGPKVSALFFSGQVQESPRGQF